MNKNKYFMCLFSVIFLCFILTACAVAENDSKHTETNAESATCQTSEDTKSKSDNQNQNSLNDSKTLSDKKQNTDNSFNNSEISSNNKQTASEISKLKEDANQQTESSKSKISKKDITDVYTETEIEINEIMYQILIDDLNNNEIEEKKQLIYDIANQASEDGNSGMYTDEDYIDYVINNLLYNRTQVQKLTDEINQQYPNLNEQQVQQILTLRLIQGYPNFRFSYNEAILAGLIDEDDTKLTIAVARDIIKQSESQSNRLSYIKTEFAKVQEYEDIFFDNSEFNIDYASFIDYYSNNYHDKIEISENDINYYQLDDDGNVIYEELLYTNDTIELEE